jgi:hypothetical protein
VTILLTGEVYNFIYMKKFLFVLVVFLFWKAANAQVMQAKAQWANLAIPQLKCWECKDRLERYMLQEKGPNDDAGIIRWTINLNTGTMRIQFIPDRMTLDYIRIAVANAGFDVDTVMANEDSYKMLPPICKRAAEGGGQQKGAPSCKIPPQDRVGMVALPKQEP